MKVHRYLRAPDLGDDAANREAVVVLGLLRVVAAGTVVVLLLGFLDPANNPLFGMAMYLPLLALLWLGAGALHRGHVRRVAWAVALLFWGFVSFSVFAFGGLQFHNGAAYIVSVMLAVTAIDGRVGMGFAVSAAAVGALAVVAEFQGWLPQALVEMTPFNSWLGLSIPLLMATVMVRQSKGHLDRALERERARALELRRAERAAKLRARQGQALGVLGHAVAGAQSQRAMLDEAGSLLSHTLDCPMPVIALSGHDGWLVVGAEIESLPSESVLGQLTQPRWLEAGEGADPLPAPAATRRWMLMPIPHPDGARGVIAVQLEWGQAGAEDFLAAAAALLGAAVERDSAMGRMLQAQKLEAVGRMAGGVAHDFNNLLMVILGASEVLRIDAPDDRLVQSIEAASHRAALLTRQLLMFSRGGIPEAEAVVITDLVRASVPLLDQMVPAHVRLVVDVPPGGVEPTALASRVAIEQILLNLVLNGAQAIGPHAGVVTIEVRAESEVVLLAIEDTGPGVLAHARGSIFEPFFTTRQAGTGLGLATVRDIVERLDGDVRLVQRAGAGARFEVRLPSVQPPPSEREVMGSRPSGRSRVVLLVDDEPMVRDSVAAMLEASDWVVHTAEHGAQAVDLLSKGLRPDVVLSDVVMPELDGLGLARWIGDTLPDLPVVLMSGWHQGHEGIDDLPGTVFALPKPFLRVDLLQRLDAAVARSRAG